jgi:anti-sigma B factor antagonist
MAADAPAPALTLETFVQDDATVVRCHGRLTFHAAGDFKARVKALMAETRRLALDLGDLSYMDSSGLGAVVGIYVSAKAARCDLRVVNLSKPVRQLLGITHLLSMFEACGEYSVKLP